MERKAAHMSLILCIDKDKNTLDLLAFNLEARGYDVATAESANVGFEMIMNRAPSLIIMHQSLPDIDGIDVCRLLKAKKGTCAIPIIITMSKDSEIDKVLSLENGADDCITKPFSVPEMLARVNALLRRCKTVDMPDVIKIGNLMIDSRSNEVYRRGEMLRLTLKEFELLRMMARTPGKVWTRSVLLDRVWGYEFFGQSRTVDVHIRHLRGKLQDDAALIQTVRGVGYKIVEPCMIPRRAAMRPLVQTA